GAGSDVLADLEQGDRVGVGAWPELDVFDCVDVVWANGTGHGQLLVLMWASASWRPSNMPAPEVWPTVRRRAAVAATDAAGSAADVAVRADTSAAKAGSASPSPARRSSVVESRVVRPGAWATAAARSFGAQGSSAANKVASSPQVTSSPKGVRPEPRP